MDRRACAIGRRFKELFQFKGLFTQTHSYAASFNIVLITEKSKFLVIIVEVEHRAHSEDMRPVRSTLVTKAINSLFNLRISATLLLLLLLK